MSKIYVLDTNVLLADTKSIFSFEDNDVIIPSTVIEEIKQQIREKRQYAEEAKEVNKIIQKLVASKKEEIVPLKNGGTFKIESHQGPLDIFKEDANDNRILATVKYLSEKEKEKENRKPVILVSIDTVIRLKADALGLCAVDYIAYSE